MQLLQDIGDGYVSIKNHVAMNEVTGDSAEWKTTFTPAQRPGRQTGLWKVGIETVFGGKVFTYFLLVSIHVCTCTVKFRW